MWGNLAGRLGANDLNSTLQKIGNAVAPPPGSDYDDYDDEYDDEEEEYDDDDEIEDSYQEVQNPEQKAHQELLQVLLKYLKPLNGLITAIWVLIIVIALSAILG